MAPALTGSTTTATSSRRSSTSSISLPFQTPPTSPKVNTISRIPKPSSSSSLTSTSSGVRVHSGKKPRSRSHSAGAGNAARPSSSRGASPVVYRADGRVVLPHHPSSSPASTTGSLRRPSLTYSQSEGKERLLAPSPHGSPASAGPSTLVGSNVNPQTRAATVATGLGLIGGGAGSKLPTAVSTPTPPSLGARSATIPRTASPSHTTSTFGDDSSWSSSPTATMQRTDSSEGSSSRQVASVPGSSAGPRRQRSASSLPRRTIASPRAPVPPLPPGAKTPCSAPAPDIAGSQSLIPSRSRSSGEQPPLSSSTSPQRHYQSPSASTTASSSIPTLVSRAQQRERTTQPPHGPSSPSSPPSSSLGRAAGNGAGGPTGAGHAPHVNGISGGKGTPPRSSTSSSRSRGPSRDPSPSKAKGKQRAIPQLSPPHSSDSPRPSRGGSGPPSRRGSSAEQPEDLTGSASGSTQPLVSTRSRIPRKEDTSLPTVTLPSHTSPPPSHTSSRGFGDESSLNHSTTPPQQPSGLPIWSASGGLAKSPPTSPTRKAPGLTIAPPPPPMSSRRISMPPPRTGAGAPPPAVPAKSPLRALNASVTASSRRHSRAVGNTELPPFPSPVPPVPPLPEGLCLAPEPPAVPTGQDEVLSPRPNVRPPETRSFVTTEPILTKPTPSEADMLSVSQNSISLNSGPPSEDGAEGPSNVDGSIGDSPALSQPSQPPADQSPELSGPRHARSWSHASIGSEATHGHSVAHGGQSSDDHWRGVPFTESHSEMTLKAQARTASPAPSPAGTHETLSASPESKARLSVSTSSTSAPVTPAASLPGNNRSMQLGSRPSSEVETVSSSSENNFPSACSPDSAPPSAPASSVNLWAVGARYDSPSDVTDTGAGMHIRGSDAQETLTDGVLWGQKHTSSLQPPVQLSEVRTLPRVHLNDFQDTTPTTPVSGKFIDKDLPVIPAGTPPRTPQTPHRPTGALNGNMRSPSMPQIGANKPQNGSSTEVETPLGSPSFQRSQTGPAGLRPPAIGTRPQSMLIPSSASASPSPSPTHMTRRAHLLREIVHTERTHATDLALVRDAYVGQYFHPESAHHSSDASTPPLGDSTRHSRRSSSYGSPMEELGRLPSGHQSDRRTSGQPSDGQRRTSYHQGDGGPRRTSGHERRTSTADSSWSWMSPVIKSPRDASSSTVGGSTADLTYPTSTATSSTTSLQTPSLLTSPKMPSTPGSMNGLVRAGAGRPLSHNDVKTVFLNIGEMAAASDALATEFEAMLGSLDDEVSTPPGGEGTSDRLGEAFVKALPRLRPLYTYYCSRQAQASVRLLELQNDPSYAAHLNECWAKVRSHTHAWNLDSMLIKPVQRITKYPLLFEDLLSCTTPGHPDYHGIRQAAEGAKALAQEVDEAKRRKDVITSVMSGRPGVMSGRSSSTVTLTKDSKGPAGGRLLRRFKKDKSASGHDPNALPNITPYAQAQLRDLAKRLADCDRNVRRLLVELPDWCEASKFLLRQKMDINMYFLKWYALGRRVTNDDRIEKVARFSGVLDNVLTGAWEDLNQTVRGSVLVNLEKLQEATKNPLAIIAKLDEKSDVYSRYVAHRQAKKHIDKLLLQEASEYVTVHTQLLEELPPFLEGFTRIYELSMAAFTGAQTKYFESLRDNIALYSAQYLTEPTETVADGSTIKEVRLDVSTPRGIHKAWIERWREPNSIMRSLQITGGDGSRDTLTRANNLNAGHTSRGSGGSGSSRPRSRPMSTHRPASSWHRESSLLKSPVDGRSDKHSSTKTLRHASSATTASQQSSLEVPGNPRRRSLSLATDTPPGATGPELRPDSGSIFGSLIRRASHRDRRAESSTSLVESGSSSSNPSARSTIIRRAGSVRRRSDKSAPASTSTSTRSSAAQSIRDDEDSERHSFGLPRIPTETKFLFDPLSLDSQKAEPLYASVLVETESPVSYTTTQNMSLSALGLGDVTPPTVEEEEPDVGETWRESRVLYSCCVVADFDPAELGNLRFNGLRFLTLVAGDMIDVFHEIGRVAELDGFPYSQAGVDNDGALIARSERGQIGVAMCSFLEPLRS